MNKELKELGYEKFEHFVGMIAGKWKLRILFMLGNHGILRYNELKRLVTGITHKMLSSQLKELESDGLIIRKVYNQIPPKVEYSLSEKGRGLKAMGIEMYNWINKYDN